MGKLPISTDCLLSMLEDLYVSLEETEQGLQDKCNGQKRLWLHEEVDKLDKVEAAMLELEKKALSVSKRVSTVYDNGSTQFQLELELGF